MSSTADLSLIVSVYNREDVVRLVLAALGRQSYLNFEVVVADDGSGPAIANLVREAREKYDFTITHVWHEDSGWRKNRILNAAIRASTTEYLVFIDGDCLPGRDFLRDHRSQKEDAKVLLGRRVEMSERWAERLSVDDVLSGRFERIGPGELLDGLRGKALRLEDGIRISNPLIRRLVKRKSTRILGSNFSIHRKDIEAINGFDEMYDGPGHGEDSDVQYRLSLIGVTGKSLRNLAVQYHVYHHRTAPSDRSLKRFEEVKMNRDPVCKAGLRPAGGANRDSHDGPASIVF